MIFNLLPKIFLYILNIALSSSHMIENFFHKCVQHFLTVINTIDVKKFLVDQLSITLCTHASLSSLRIVKSVGFPLGPQI